jgi:hypothetical protein
MRQAIVLSATLLLARGASAGPAGGEIEQLLKDSHCSETPRPGAPGLSPAAPLTMQMPKVPLAKVFAVLGGLVTKGCTVRFDVAPEVASMLVTVELRNVRLETALDVLAGNNNLIYVIDNGVVHVRAKPREDQPRTSLRLSLSFGGAREATLRPKITLLPGGCGPVIQSAGGDAALRLHPESAVLEKETNVSGTRVNLCLEKVSGAGLDLLGEAVVSQVFDGGYRSRQDRTVFRKTVGAGQKDVVLFKGPDAPFELKLLEYETETPAKSD